MDDAALARDSVTVGSRPSGTSATVTPMANSNPSRAGVPSASARPKNSSPTPRATNATTVTTRLRERVSGLTGG